MLTSGMVELRKRSGTSRPPLERCYFIKVQMAQRNSFAPMALRHAYGGTHSQQRN